MAMLCRAMALPAQVTAPFVACGSDGQVGPNEAPIDGGTTGRYQVARVVARVFPSRRDFVEHVIDIFDGASDYVFSPFAADKLTVQTDRLARFKLLRTLKALELPDGSRAMVIPLMV